MGHGVGALKGEDGTPLQTLAQTPLIIGTNTQIVIHSVIHSFNSHQVKTYTSVKAI